MEKFRKKWKRNRNGITLVALVITIIILLILAGIAIASLTGDNGLFARANQARQNTIDAQNKENATLEGYEDLIDIYAEGAATAGTVNDAKLESKRYAQTTTIKDDLNNDVVIPMGFKVSSDSATIVEDGVVIEDKNGNQFVWIPAKTGEGAELKLSNGKTVTIKYERLAYGSNIATGTNDDKTNSEIINYSNSSNNFFIEEMPIDEVSSINRNGGYYIGRYESGDKESTLIKEMRNEDSSQNNTVTIQKNQVPYNYITFNNLKKLAEQMDTSNGYATATTKLVSSYAWDTAISFIQKVNDGNEHSDYATNSIDGNYKNTEFTYTNLSGNQQTKNTGDETVVLTGQTKEVCNIYDLGGNLWEYTTEICSNINAPYTDRGGCYGSEYNIEPAGYRSRSAGTAYISDGFRVTLYI